MFRLFTVLATWFVLSLSALASVNINTAGPGELESLPGIGPSKAAAIVDYRVQNGPFGNIDDLDNVPGIGPATLTNLRPLVSTSGESAPADSAAMSAAKGSAKSTPTGAAVNINDASAKELESLPGIGPSKAAAIVSDRQENGPYAACTDLSRVHGIGPATLANMGKSCTVK